MVLFSQAFRAFFWLRGWVGEAGVLLPMGPYVSPLGAILGQRALVLFTLAFPTVPAT
jgi:hypothetical protein